MQTLRRVGMDTAQLTDEEILYIEDRVIEAVRPQLVGRKLFPVTTLPHAGFLTVRGYKLTDMSQARISLYGQGRNKDRTVKTPFDVTVPVIHKEFEILWRDLEASRYRGQPLDLQDAMNAAHQVAEEEDKLLLTGEYTGWKAMGIEGLATATGRNTQASAGAWPANAITDLNAAIAKLEEDGHTNKTMRALVLNSTFMGKLRDIVTNQARKYIDVIQDGSEPVFPAGIYVSNNLYTSAGAQTNALIIELGRENFEMFIARDATLFTKEDEDMNLQCKLHEVVTPRINRPTAICELTGLT